MVLDGDDRPFASFLWPGNTADVTRLMPVVRRLRERFGIAQICIVADRGMISAAAIATLEKAGLQYILGVRERSTKEVRSEVIDDDGVAVPLTIARRKGETHRAAHRCADIPLKILLAALDCILWIPCRPTC